jgi:hypothetical protein
MINSETREIIVNLSDAHIPYHDPVAMNIAIDFVRYLKPFRVVIHEWLDWYSLSKFDKDPKRKIRLQDDIDIAIGWLEKLRSAIPDAKIVMIGSNHEDRLRKYLWSKAEELSGLRCLELPALLHLKEMDITHQDDYTFRGVLFKHGSVIRKHSGYTARAELEKEGVSGCSGHTHRMSQHYKTLRGGSYVWMETGCLCDPEQAEYIDGTADWQRGLGGFIFKKGSKHFYPFLCPIIDGEILWG